MQGAYKLSEIEHQYGKNVHILSDPFLLTHLSQLCSETTVQPLVNQLVETLYRSLLQTVVNAEFPVKEVRVPTRMSAYHPEEGVYSGPGLDPNTTVVSVNLARAGTVPSHICYSALNYFISPKNVRQDHISIARTTGDNEKITGSAVSGHKIGGSIDGSIVLFPDPMGATGSTLIEALHLYKKHGRAKKFISLHCIITPEYLRNVLKVHPELVVYAIRLDRGLSSAEVLRSVPGSQWERERGLNSKDYIVPGGGGFGEVLNNAFV